MRLGFFGLLQAGLIIAKVCGVSVSWWAVFIPSYILIFLLGGLFIIFLIEQDQKQKKRRGLR